MPSIRPDKSTPTNTKPVDVTRARAEDGDRAKLKLVSTNDDEKTSGQLNIPDILKIVTDNTQDRIMVFDRTGHYAYVNPALCKLHNVTPEEIIGQHFSNYLSLKEINMHAQSNLNRCIAGDSFIFQTWRNDPNGRRVYLEVNWHAYLDEATSTHYAVVRVCDQTNEQTSRIALNKTHKQLKDYLKASADWLWETDNSYRFSWISDSVTSKYGIKPQALLNKQLEDVFVPCDGQNNLLTLPTQGFDPGPIRDIDVDFKYDGKTARIQISCIPMLDDNGAFNGFRGSVRAVSELRAIQQQAILANRRFVQAIDSFNGSFALFDADEALVNYNQTYREIHSFLGDELKPGLKFERCLRIQLEKDIIQPGEGLEEQWIAERLEQFRNPQGPFVVSKADNKWYKITEHRLEDGGCFKTMEDISEMKNVELALRESEQRFKDFAETAADWFWEMDEELKLTYVSDRYEELTGQPSESILGSDATNACTVLMSEADTDMFNAATSDRKNFENIQITYELNDGELRYFSLNGRPRFTDDGVFVGYRGIARNVTHAKQLSDQLHHQAHYDSLTGLKNRREFNNQLANAREDLERHGTPFVLGFMDLDQFKIVNDSEGHLSGDRLLKEVSDLFKQQLRSSDVLGRLGGDEFGVLFKGCRISDALELSDKISRVLKAYRFSCDDKTYGVTTSIGLVEVLDTHLGADELLRRADIACFTAKGLGRNQVHTYASNDEETRQHQQAILHAAGIEQAIEQDEFTLFVQPIAEVTDTATVIKHYEVLLRLRVGDTLVLPGAFIPVAERFRLMSDIDRWVVRKSFEQIALFDLANDADPPCQFTINLSGASLTDAGLADYICEQLAKQCIEPQRICFEITETAVVSNFERASDFVKRLRDMGILFALDDFGSGMSSFAYLRQFEVDYLKIDGSLITDINENLAGRTMVAAINQMAHVLGMKTIAEFVESDQSIEVLRELGVNMLQGYAIGRPRPML